MSISKTTFGALDYFAVTYQQRYGKKPRINKYREKWGMQEVLDDVGYEYAREIIDYYMSLERSDHTLPHFYSNYDRLATNMERRNADRVARQKLMAKTREVMQNDG